MINVAGLSVTAKDITDIAERTRPLSAKVCSCMHEVVCILMFIYSVKSYSFNFHFLMIVP